MIGTLMGALRRPPAGYRGLRRSLLLASLAAVLAAPGLAQTSEPDLAEITRDLSPEQRAFLAQARRAADDAR